MLTPCGNILRNDDLKEARVNKTDKARIKWRTPQPGMNQRQLVGDALYRLLKIVIHYPLQTLSA